MWGGRRGGERARRSSAPGAPLCPEEVSGVLPRGMGLGCGGPVAQHGVVLWGEEGSVGPGCQAGAPERLFGPTEGAGAGCHRAGLPAWDRVAAPGSLFLAPRVVFRLLKLAALSRIGRGKSGFPHGQGALHWGRGKLRACPTRGHQMMATELQAAWLSKGGCTQTLGAQQPS